MMSKPKSQTLKATLALSLLVALSACNKISFSPEENKVLTEPPVPTEEIVPISKTISVEPAKNNPNLDILLVIDDSSSMKPDILKLANRMSNFTSLLDASGMQWQMCLTTTQGYLKGIRFEFGYAVPWYVDNTNRRKVISRGQKSLDSIFKKTFDSIPVGGANSTDERGLRATVEHIQKNPDCYRKDAKVAVILISDEDEASVGGIPSRIRSSDDVSSFRPLSKEELPEGRLASIKNLLGNINFTFNSIIILPGDRHCEDAQNTEAAAYSGDRYAEMSTLTGGGVGSICDTDYSKNLKLFKEKIVNTLKTIELECKPHRNVVRVAINGKTEKNFKLEDTTLTFDQPVVEGSTIQIKYECARPLPGKGDLENPVK